MAIRDAKPMKLEVTRDWPEHVDREAELHFDTSQSLQHVEMLAIWGPGPRQQRSFQFQETDLLDLHEWLSVVLGLEKDRD